jgi:hypothetical protein
LRLQISTSMRRGDSPKASSSVATAHVSPAST